MRIEPKTFFANERTFLTWLHMAVTIGTIAAALLGFSGSAQRAEKPKYGVCSLLVAAPLFAVQLCMCFSCCMGFFAECIYVHVEHDPLHLPLPYWISVGLRTVLRCPSMGQALLL